MVVVAVHHVLKGPLYDDHLGREVVHARQLPLKPLPPATDGPKKIVQTLPLDREEGVTLQAVVARVDLGPTH
jgi:hypothetical protein